MIKKVLIVLIMLLAVSSSAFAQAITAGKGSYRTVLKNDKFKTTTKVEHIANNSDRVINVSVVTYYVKEQYTGGTFLYNKILSAKNVGLIYPGAALFNVKFSNQIKPFYKKGYVYTLIYDQDTNEPYWFYNYKGKANFGNLQRASAVNSDRSILIASGEAE